MLQGYIQVTNIGATAFIEFAHGVGIQAQGETLNDVVAQMRTVGTVLLGAIDRQAGTRRFSLDFDKIEQTPISLDSLSRGLANPVSAEMYYHYDGTRRFRMLGDGQRHEVPPY